MFPFVQDDLEYFMISRIFSLAVVFVRLILCASFYKAANRFYYVLSNRILYKAQLDPQVVEQRRNFRVTQNINEKRQEKNLNTVIESVNEVNETEHQRTSHGQSMKNRGTKTRIETMISEEANEDYEDGNFF